MERSAKGGPLACSVERPLRATQRRKELSWALHRGCKRRQANLIALPNELVAVEGMETRAWRMQLAQKAIIGVQYPAAERGG